MVGAPRRILDQFGKPYRPRRALLPGSERVGLAPPPPDERPAGGSTLRATADAARDGVWLRNYWANRDRLDADSANSRENRLELISRSRYEAANSGYYAGALRTYATDLVGRGPTLVMLSGSTTFNQMVEREFEFWAEAVGLRRKLWAMAHARVQDGEAFAVLRYNPRVDHRAALDVVLYEAEQIATPYLAIGARDAIDGVQFDQYGEPVSYHLLPAHPGAGSAMVPLGEVETIPAKFVCHWFRCERPGQHRGTPELMSTLNLGAMARRMREATVQAAETAARFGALLETPLPASAESNEEIIPDQGAAFDAVELPGGAIVQLPFGNKATQLKPEHPSATFKEYTRQIINEQFRPLAMPYNKAACDSSDYNYASGRLDHQTYYAELDSDRSDCDRTTLNVIFRGWFLECVRQEIWFADIPVESVGAAAMRHTWAWPKHRAVDLIVEAEANDTTLKNGQRSLSAIYAEAGEDFEDSLGIMAADYGLTVDEMRKVLLHTNLTGAAALRPPPAPAAAIVPAGAAAPSGPNGVSQTP